MKLNARQQKFVVAYIKSGNATQSAIAAGYSANGAEVQGHRLLSNVNIAAAIAKPVIKAGVTVERVIQEYAAIGFHNPQDFYDSDGRMLGIKEMPEHAARAIAGIEEEDIFQYDLESKQRIHVGRLKKIKLAAKVPALDSLARHLGMFQDGGNGSGSGLSIVLHLGGTA